MRDVHHFEIDVKLEGIGTTILMDGRPLSGVRSICVDVETGRISKVTLEIEATAKIFGDSQVWIKDSTTDLVEKSDAAEARATAADARTVLAEARADAAESTAAANLDGATLAYIVPVAPAKPDGVIKK